MTQTFFLVIPIRLAVWFAGRKQFSVPQAAHAARVEGIKKQGAVLENAHKSQPFGGDVWHIKLKMPG
jgi:hypothetical protein